jgi:hypothetical protein
MTAADLEPLTHVLPKHKHRSAPWIEWTPVDTDGAEVGVLTVHGDRGAAEYLVSEFPADGGRGFSLAKLAGGTDPEAEGYDLFACGKGGAPTCECKGFYTARHCKHADAVAALILNKWL